MFSTNMRKTTNDIFSHLFKPPRRKTDGATITFYVIRLYPIMNYTVSHAKNTRRMF